MIKAQHKQYEQISPDRESINFIVRSIINETEKTWTSAELHDKYIEKGGTESRISRFINRILEHMTEELYCFNASGLASIIMHREKASKMFKIVNKKDDDEDLDLKNVANRIKTEVKQALILKNTMLEITIPTLENLLTLVSPKLSNSKTTAYNCYIKHINTPSCTN